MNTPGRRTLRNSALLGTVVVAACLLLGTLLPVREWMEVVVERVEDMGAVAWLIYLALYIVLATLSIPTTPLNLTSGILFGVLLGSAIALVSGWTAAVAQFLFARHLARESLEARLDSLPRLQAVIDAVDSEAFKVITLARLSPFIPASVKNFGFALTSCKTRTFALATLVGQVPVVAAHVYLGWVGGEAVLSESGSLGPVQVGLIVLGVAASIALLVGISIHARRGFLQPETAA